MSSAMFRRKSGVPRRRPSHVRSGAVRLAALAVGSVALLAACGSSSSTNNPSTSTTADATSQISASRCTQNQSAGTIKYISPEGYDASPTVIEVFMAEHLGYFKDLCLNVDIDAVSHKGKPLVSAGTAQVTALGAAGQVMTNVANGANFVGVSTYGNVDPHSIITNVAITNLKQLEGKTLAYDGVFPAIAREMMIKAGVDLSKVKLVKSPSDDPTIVTRGMVDGLVSYVTQQEQELKNDNLPFTQFLPTDFGLTGTDGIMIMNKDWLANNRTVAADFMRANLHAMEYCLANKPACVNYMTGLAAQNNQSERFSAQHQTQIFDTESSWIASKAGPVGAQTGALWMPEYAFVKNSGASSGLLTPGQTLPPLENMMDTTLVASLYNGTTLSWPGTS